MVKPSDAIQALAYAGVGSGVGAIIAAFISAHSKKGSARAEAADLLTEAAERVARVNIQLDNEVRKLRGDLELVAEAIDKFLGREITSSELRKIARRMRFEDFEEHRDQGAE